MFIIRPVQPNDDAPAITAIYREEVLHGTASWEYDPPDEAEMTRRMNAVLAQGYPYFVALADGVLAGYSYASTYRPRIGYRFTCEDSIYVHNAYRGQGVARALLATLMSECAQRGYRQMMAVIGDSANAASIGLHKSLGFEQVGLFRNIGYKFDRWLDGVYMQKAL